MKDKQLGEMETRFAELIWERAPIPSGELVKLCDEKLGWKKSTTYTMLRRLVQRGIFESRDSIVSTRISREEFASMQSERFVEETFGGSLPAFLAAFTSRKKISDKEVDELLQIIEQGK